MGGGYNLTEVEQGLLGHGKVYKIRLEAIQKAGKLELIQRIQRELAKGDGQGSEIVTFWLPVIAATKKDCVLVLVVNLLEMLQQTVDVPAGAIRSTAGIYNDMHEYSLQ